MNDKAPDVAPEDITKIGPLLNPKEAQRLAGISDRSQFWDIIHENKVPIVRYTARCIRIPKVYLLEMIASKLVRSSADAARLADGRRS